MPNIVNGKVSIGRYNNGPCYVEICDATHRLVHAEMELDEFAKALTSMGERPAKLSLYSNEPKIQHTQITKPCANCRYKIGTVKCLSCCYSRGEINFERT